MVDFLANNSGLDVSLLTYHGFAYDGKTLLAKQVDVGGTSEPDHHPKRRRRSVAEFREELARRIEDLGVRELFDAVRLMFRENWPESRESPGSNGLNIQLAEVYRKRYARIDAWSEARVGLVFFPNAKALCLDAFRQPVEQIRYSTWPRDREPLEDPGTEIQFPSERGSVGDSQRAPVLTDKGYVRGLGEKRPGQRFRMIRKSEHDHQTS